MALPDQIEQLQARTLLAHLIGIVSPDLFSQAVNPETPEPAGLLTRLQDLLDIIKNVASTDQEIIDAVRAVIQIKAGLEP